MGLKEELEKRGVKSSALADRPLNFIGSTADITFDDMAARLRALFTLTSTDVASIGDAYDTGFYQKIAGSKDRTYESVYGRVDWSRAAQDPSTLQVLEEAFGNNDNAPSEPDINPSDLQKIYGVAKTAPNKKTPKELATASGEAQNNTRQVRDSSTKGIRGVADIDAPIDPFA
jgi:hypothetical protein